MRQEQEIEMGIDGEKTWGWSAPEEMESPGRFHSWAQHSLCFSIVSLGKSVCSPQGCTLYRVYLSVRVRCCGQRVNVLSSSGVEILISALMVL